MMNWLAFAGDFVAIAGTLILTLSVIGIVRGTDIKFKIHAASTAAMLGLPLVLAAPLFTGQIEIWLRVLVVGVFSALTAPIASYALARLEREMRAQEDRPPVRATTPD